MAKFIVLFISGDTVKIKINENSSPQFGLQQLINEPKHLVADSSSCIDLIFTSEPNLVMESGVQSSLHPNCHHQITYAKFNLKIYYPPPYEREIWHYGKANVDHIRKAINEFPWGRSLENNSVNEKVNIFNTTIKNILSNYIPHETITCGDRVPPWINKNIKQLIIEKNQAYKSYLRSNKSLQFINHFQFLQTKLNSLIEESKEKYYVRLSKKLLDPQTSQNLTGQY